MHYFHFEQVDGLKTIAESYALRYEVYCKERGFLPEADYPDGREMDEYDSRSSHFAGFYKDGTIAGTARMIEGPIDTLPLTKKCRLDAETLPDDIATAGVAEISRLAVSKAFRRRMLDGMLPGLQEKPDRKRTGPASRRRNCPELVLGLYKALYQYSKRSGIDYWFAAMEGSLAKLLNRFFFEFRPVGPEIDYYGPVRPYILARADWENRVHEGSPDLFWAFMQGLDDAHLPAIARGAPDAHKYRQRFDRPGS